MIDHFRGWLTHHPVLRDSLLWAVPALLFGAVVRLLLISYLPYAFWGADSRSYFSFAHQLIAHHDISLDEKRRYLYPILMLPVALLPGVPLRWLAVLQHTLGVASLLPLAYIVRKTMTHWRWWLIPVTVLYAGLPVLVWYEHELLAENVFFAALLWAFAGWVAWVSGPRSRELFWWFFVPFAAFILTKPSGRFVWPGIIIGIITLGVWRGLGWKRLAALGLLALVTLTVGSKKQGAWLLYTAAFPLTQLQTPLHAEYKAEIAGLVEPLRRNPDTYYLHDGEPFGFLRNPSEQNERPLWKALEADSRLKARIYMDLALEGIKAEPGLFLYFGLQRCVSSSNLSGFGVGRFDGDSFAERSEHFYTEGVTDESNRVRLAFGLPSRGPIPPYAEFQHRLNPAPDSTRARLVQRWFNFVGGSLDFVSMPEWPKEERILSRARPTILGCWLIAAVCLSFLPAYRRTFGVWVLVAGSYIYGVFLVSQENARYFAPAWIVIIPLLAIPADVISNLARRVLRR